jgi:type I restriction enzyme S subunit
MSANQTKYPQLRFKGFTDPWEKRKLSDLFIKGGSGGTPKSTNKAFYDGDIPFLGISDITKSNGFINNTEKHISSDGLNSSAAWIVSKGAISLAMYASVGKLAILNIDAATSQAFYNMIFDDYDLRDLVYQRLNKANELSEWNKLISTGTQSNLNADKVKNFQMYLPKNHDEIKLISTFFKQIDNTIVLHQRKLAKLKELKQGYLQKLFPKNGSKFPQLRFAGFADDWEQRKLNEVSDIYDGTHQTPKYQDNGVMFLSVENIKTLTSNKFISREAFEDEFKIRPQRGDVLMTRIGDIGTANVVETDEDLAYYVSLALFKSEELNPYFLQASIYAPFVQDQIWKRTLHIAFPKKINKNEIGQVPINVPTLAEQTKIGSFFKQLDNTITLHQRKLDLLKEQKKGFLQKMFV